MNKSILTCIFLCFLVLSLNAQKEAFNWQLGIQGSMTFNTSDLEPIKLDDGVLQNSEGTSVISDPCTGEFIFSTNGVEVFNKNQQRMPNGGTSLSDTANGLYGCISTTQTLIIPKPESDKEYYIITIDCNEKRISSKFKGLRYSVVDMNLDNGLGDISPLKKNVLLMSSPTEKVTACKHSNGCDYWILTHKYNSDAFHAYLLTKDGISDTVISNVGRVHFSDNGNDASLGQMILSPKADKLAVVISSLLEPSHGFELFDFDKSTGLVSNPLVLSADPTIYGTAFSPDGSKLYTSTYNPAYLHQYDLVSPNPDSIPNDIYIIASRTLINKLNSGQYYGALQLAPNGRIYAAKWESSKLAVIGNPNLKGLNCGYDDNGFLIGKTLKGGTPNFVVDFLNPKYVSYTKPEFESDEADYCEKSMVNFNQTNNLNCSSPSGYFTWDFGDGATYDGLNPSHAYVTSGNYTITLTELHKCGEASDTVEIIIPKCDQDSLFIPNLFTPNGDDRNDEFVVYNEGLESYAIKIYNRWGELVFESINPNDHWNGYSNSGIEVPEGTYFYVLNAKAINGSEYSKKDFLYLVR